MDSLLLVCAQIVAAIGAFEDLRHRRIPNRLTYSCFVAALFVRTLGWGWAGLSDGIIASLIAGGLLFVLFLVRGLGAGDVKLMAAVSAWAGMAHIANLLGATAVAGGIMAIVYAIFGGRVSNTIRNSFDLLRHHLVWGLRPHPVLNIDVPDSGQVPFGPAIALGTAYCLARTLLWG